MDLENLNPTAPEAAQSGGPAEVVAPQTETPTQAAGQESVVGSQPASSETASRQSDFDLVYVEDGDTESPTQAAGRENVVGSQGGEQQEKSQTNGGVPESGTGSGTQTREENAAIRAARLRARREAEMELAARADEEISHSGVKNPYTGKPFANMKEFREYGEAVRQAELAAQAQRTGRSVEELSEDAANREFVSNLRRQQEQRAADLSAAQAQRSWFEQDVLNFVEKYPQFGVEKLQELEANRQFRQFCGSRFGREPLATLYGDYCALVGDAGKAAVSREATKAARSTGGGGKDSAMLSPTQKTALDRWNADHPEMAMTAKEFLGR